MPNDYSYTEIDKAKGVIDEVELLPSTLETVDYALMDFINEKMNIHATTNEGWKVVNTIWITSERAHQIKNNKDLRDSDGTLKLPLITVERSSIEKSLSRKGTYFGGSANFIHPYYGGRITIAKKIVQDKTNNFAKADAKRLKGQENFPRKNEKVIIETLSAPMPIYVSIKYNITLRTEYQQQMNEMLTPFINLGGHINSFSIKRDGHSYETFISSNFQQNDNVSSLGTEERRYETTIDTEVLGYLIGEGPNGERPKIIRRENAVEVKLPRERVIAGDIPQHIDKQGFYR